MRNDILLVKRMSPPTERLELPLEHQELRTRHCVLAASADTRRTGLMGFFFVWTRRDLCQCIKSSTSASMLCIDARRIRSGASGSGLRPSGSGWGLNRDVVRNMDR